MGGGPCSLRPSGWCSAQRQGRAGQSRSGEACSHRADAGGSPGTYDWKKQVSISRQVAEAWLSNAQGKKDEAIRIMRAAADLDDATEKHPVTPGAILPAREQLGDLLLELGRPAEALAAYEGSLERAPRRLAGLYGAARAATLVGDSTKAARYYAALADVTKSSEGTRAEVREARTFVGAAVSR